MCHCVMPCIHLGEPDSLNWKKKIRICELWTCRQNNVSIWTSDLHKIDEGELKTMIGKAETDLFLGRKEDAVDSR